MKAHLLSAVSEEVTELRQRIRTLNEKLSILEHENSYLRSQVSPEAIPQFSSTSNGNSNISEPPNPISTISTTTTTSTMTNASSLGSSSSVASSQSITVGPPILQSSTLPAASLSTTSTGTYPVSVPVTSTNQPSN